VQDYGKTAFFAHSAQKTFSASAVKEMLEKVDEFSTLCGNLCGKTAGLGKSEPNRVLKS